ncbi:MAG: hypothetical protein IJL62_02705 [Clostridia bacterium]|nr:hypothetical protein [Clostridia bacterium]MBQ5991438.1 hypothetical protein [Clostridia bacterium]
MASKKKKKTPIPKKNETPLTMKDVAIEAESITRPFEEKTKKQRKFVVENATAIIAFLTIGLLIILFAYNKGFYGVYNVPVECIPVDLKSYLPIAIQGISVLVWVIMIISYFKTDIALNRYKFNFVRVLYGHMVLMNIMIANNYNILLNKVEIAIPSTNRVFPLGRILFIIIPAFVSIGVELIILFLRKPRKNTNLSKQEFAMKRHDFVFSRFFRSYYKGWIFIFVMAVLAVPILGKLSAKAKREYQIITVDEATYAVIFTETDRFLVQSATVQDKLLMIDTSSFRYYDKDAGDVRYLQFDEVVLDRTYNP